MKRIILVAAAAALAACATTTPRYQQRPLREPAENLFAIVSQPCAGLSMLVDLEAMREQGLLPAPVTGQSAEGQPRPTAMVDLYVAMLPAMMSVAESDADRANLARAAVYWRLIDQWAVWPHVQRFGVRVPMSADVEPSMERILDTAVLVLAVDQDEAKNRELLRGFAALGRSFRASANPGANAIDLPPIELEKGELCISVPELPQQLCLHGGEGYYALGTRHALQAALAETPPVETPEEITVRKNDLFRLRFEAAQLGTTSVRLSGRGTLRLSALLDKAAPPFVEKLHSELTKLVARWDESSAATRTLVGAEVDRVKGNLASDAKASPAVKTTALGMTVDSVLDPEGHSAEMRRSLKIIRGERKLYAEVSFSEALVRKFTANVGQTTGMSVVATAGVLSAIAIPNFVKFQCRSKQAEAKSNFNALLQSQVMFRQEKNAWASTFTEAAFSPEIGNRYTYCMGGQCLACTRDGCEVQGVNPCSIYQAASDDFLVCAYANLNGGTDTLDVWLMNSKGQPEHVSDDCN